MRRTVLFSLISIFLIGFLSLPRSVFAESTVNISNNEEGSQTHVNVNTNTGSNTVCINGKCTTSGGSNGQSTVCINGKCTTSNGDVNINQEGADIHIKTNSSSTSVNQNSDTNTSTNVNVTVNPSPSPTASPTPKIEHKASTSAEKKEINKINLELENFFNMLKKFFSFNFFWGK